MSGWVNDQKYLTTKLIGGGIPECASPGVSPGVYVARLVALKRESSAAKTDEEKGVEIQ
ncbi:MAG: hypothetical protein F6K58_19565 [Symploca sp. SIO2E9]|nr:hypothetical protein [Symploca sp. SIO2E9]